MVARDAEFAALVAHLDATTSTGARAVEVVGEAGIGKTLLLSTFATLAQERGARILTGRASEFEREAPFAALMDALADLPHGLDGEAAPTMRHMKHRAIRGLLEQTAAEAPALLVIDDLHWADGATVDLLASLVDRPPDAPVLIVLGHRPFQAGSPVPHAIANGAAAGRIHRLVLGPLPLADAATLVGGQRSSEEIAALHAACGGNPFLLQQLARSDAPAVPLAATGTTPAAVGALLQTELAPLSEAARVLLDAAAVVGDPFEVGLAGAVAELDDAAVLAALDELLAAHLVRPTEHPRQFAFRHPLVRSSRYGGAPAGWRLAAHRRAAEALRAQGAGPSALAIHVRQCAAPGDHDAIALLAAAGKQVGSRAPASAVEWLRAAWSLVPEEQQFEPASTDILYGLGLAMTISGDGERALLLDASAIAAAPLDHPVRVRFELGRALIEETLARFDDARQRLQMVAAGIGDASTLDALTIAMTLATLEVSLGQVDEARRHVERGLAISEALGYPGLDAFVLPVAAWVHTVAGDLTAAGDACDAAQPRLAELDDAILQRYPSPLASLMRTEWALGRLDAARAHAGRGLVVTSNGEWPILASQFLSVRSLIDVLAGRLREALDTADAACEEATMIANHEARFWAHTARSAALEPTAGVERAVLEGELAVEAARNQGMVSPLAIAGQTLGRALLSARIPDRAIATILETHGGPGLPNQTLSLHAESYAILSSAELALGDRAAAERWAASAQRIAEAHDLPLAGGFAAAATAEIALHAGEPRAAARAAQEAIDDARRRGAALIEARFALLHGRALIECGEREAAGAVLRAAEAAFVTAGADRLQASAVRHLRRIGRRVTHAGRASATVPAAQEPLTARQREIAELVVAGCTNREIAERLFLSLKTVETHLSSAYVKLGVRGRAGLVERLRTST